MPAVILPGEALRGPEVLVSGEDAHYLTNVLRLRRGDRLTLLDGDGGRYAGRIDGVERGRVRIQRGERQDARTGEPPRAVHLVQALPKADKMDWIVRKTVELGVASITPMIAEHSEVRATRRRERWKAIARSAVIQSGRTRVPTVHEPEPFPLLLDRLRRPVVLFWEKSRRSLKQVIRDVAQGSGDCTLCIGPEGGFSKEEAAGARARGWLDASLGPRTLRTETAAVSALAIIQYELGDMG